MFWRWCSITRMRCLAVGIAFLTVTTAWAAGGGHGGGGHGGGGFGGSGHGGSGRGFGGFGYGGYGYGRGFGGFGYGGYGYGRGFGGFGYGGYGYGRGYGYGGYGYRRGFYGGYYPYGYGFGVGYGAAGYGYGYGLGYGTGFYGYETAPAYGYSGDASNLVGYSSSVVSDYYSPSAFAAISPASDLPDTAVVLDVRVPANAEIWVNGVKMHLTGASREFVSPPLTPSQVGTYDLRARWEEDGQQVQRTRRVTVRAGDRLSINFINPS
jgi:uncharacterized protein (TIGR03000 family)